MSKEYTLQTPLQSDDVAKLRLGDRVYLNGEIIITAGLPTHQRIIEYIEKGLALPVNMDNAVFLHMGSFSRENKGDFEVVYINPTTSTRFNPYMPAIIRKFHLRAAGGKGGLDSESVKAMKETGCVYLSVLGAGCPLFSASIRSVKAVGWSDLVPHYRLVNLQVERFGPLFTAIDAHGNSIYEDIEANIRQNMPAIISGLSVAGA